jgi:signal peptidase II
MSPGRTALRAVLVAIAVIAADQVTKAIVRGEIGPFEQVKVLPGVKLVHAENTGVAFSALSGGGPLVILVAVVALGALLVFFFTHLTRPLVWLPTGLLLGGAAGNLIDRIGRGSVTDFIKFPHWPAFNVADIATTLVIETMAGAAALLRERDGDTLGLRRSVASPGGTTARGLNALERGGVRAALAAAMDDVLEA